MNPPPVSMNPPPVSMNPPPVSTNPQSYQRQRRSRFPDARLRASRRSVWYPGLIHIGPACGHTVYCEADDRQESTPRHKG
eukprot:957470-Prorocentrum_minimum.AAC.1